MTEEINKAIEVLQKGGLILYPTDTLWAIGCDATKDSAVQKLITFLQRKPNDPMVCLVAHEGMLEKYVEKVPDLAYDILDVATRPTTIVYDSSNEISLKVKAPDGSLAVRVASDKFCQYLINKFKKPLVATIAKIEGNSTPKSFKEIDAAILKGVDYVVNLQQENEGSRASTIIKLSGDHIVKVIRE
ncbi:L-threonylcarbamoyladenylate synthase [Maribacter chungangensis]|uniref:L-threonylcarbamoyladenylate synthase n=1 Tax=Maribacter chungangensis TaxID=1069117 RepID=A0ABW3B2X7_9FLAO